jgi:hypothetical protein
MGGRLEIVSQRKWNFMWKVDIKIYLKMYYYIVVDMQSIWTENGLSNFCHHFLEQVVTT